jgi:peptidoglycan/xylan/chitin deacetylase (PgdA/CDA1 family)
MFFSNYNKEIIHQKLVPIVLHRIVEGSSSIWEDVHIDQWNRILHFATRLSERKHSDKLPLLITFDDGCDSDYKIVFPSLLECGLSATFFIITDRVGDKGYLNWQQISEMKKYGMNIGSHSKSHIDLTSISFNEACTEMDFSKKIIDDKLSSSINAFSFPYGSYNAGLIDYALSNLYEKVFTSQHGLVNPKKKVFPRNSINSRMRDDDIARIIEPNIQTIITWQVEDSLKSILKKGLGVENYKKIRRIIAGN